MRPSRRDTLSWAVPLVVWAATFAAFLPSLDNGFVDWDDGLFLVDNPDFRGLGWSRVEWMFTTLLGGTYQPLTWLTYAADHAIWGMEPMGYHLTSLLIHALNAVLFYFLGLRLLSLALPDLRGPRETRLASAFSALLFSIHPLRVESVAWASERRDVLCGFFFLLTILLYLRAQARESGPAARGRLIWWALAAFFLSLLSKGMGVTLPAVLVLLDLYPLRRLPWDPRMWAALESRELWREKIPFVLAALWAGAIAYAGKMGRAELLSFERYGLIDRFAVASYGVLFYLRKTLAPFGLQALYELPSPLEPLALPFAASAAAALVLGGLLWALRRRWPAAAAAGAAYAVCLAPVLGIVQFGKQLVADRFSYLPCLGLALLAGAGLAKGLLRPRFRVPALAAALLLASGLGALSWEQTKVWKDTESLWRRDASLDAGHAHANNRLGVAAAAGGRPEEAIGRFRRALLGRPDFREARLNLGLLLAQQGKLGEAVAHYRFALKLDALSADAHNHLGTALARQGRLAEAESSLREALRLKPGYAQAHFNLGVLLSRQGRRAESEASYREAVRADWRLAEAHDNLGLSLAASGRLEEACAAFLEAVRARPRHARAHFNWGNALASLGRLEESLRRYRESLRIEPGLREARLNLGNALARLGRLAEAAAQYRALLSQRPSDSAARENLEKVMAPRRRR